MPASMSGGGLRELSPPLRSGTRRPGGKISGAVAMETGNQEVQARSGKSGGGDARKIEISFK